MNALSAIVPEFAQCLIYNLNSEFKRLNNKCGMFCKVFNHHRREISVTKDWRKSLGMFDDHPLMKQIDKAGQLIRQQDREQGAA